jgi:hypothetical protein
MLDFTTALSRMLFMKYLSPSCYPLGCKHFPVCCIIIGARGNVVVEALCYKPEGRWFETRRGKLMFSMYLILLAAPGPEVYSASNRNEYRKKQKHISGE